MDDAGERFEVPGWIRAARHTAEFWRQLGRGALAFPEAAGRYGQTHWWPLVTAAGNFHRVEQARLWQRNWPDTLAAYGGLLNLNTMLLQRAVDGIQRAASDYWSLEGPRGRRAATESAARFDPAALAEFAGRQARLLEMVARDYPDAVAAVAPEFGLHPERGDAVKVDETDRFELYRIDPTEPGVTTDDGAKPLLVLPPFVLGANILAFLVQDNRSYVHAFANRGIPTYLRTLKDIRHTPALQQMSGEDDARDTRRFCRLLQQRHGRPVTLNGYCQGGFAALCNLLSGRLDGLVDALITCVAPMDGTRSPGLAAFLGELPPAFNDLAYGTKTLSNGNRVADGTLMGWVYKLRSIETESPQAALLRDLGMFARQDRDEPAVSKTAAALNYWLTNERFDLPLSITRMSFASYNTPIAADGTLPVRLFQQPLSLQRLREKPIPWLICYGEKDDLVEKEAALAPLDQVEARVTAFPKGHVAIATSWSDPDSKYALHKRFDDGSVGPVRFQLDLDRDGRASRAEGGEP